MFWSFEEKHPRTNPLVQNHRLEYPWTKLPHVFATHLEKPLIVTVTLICILDQTPSREHSQVNPWAYASENGRGSGS